MKNNIVLLAFFTACGQIAFSMDMPMQTFLTQEVYNLRAQEYVDLITDKGIVCLHERVQSFLKERIDKAQSIIDNKISDKGVQEEQIMFFSKEAEMRTFIEYGDDNLMCHARQAFIVMLRRNISGGLSAKIGCYIDTLADWQKDSNLEKVSYDEYKKRFNEYWGDGHMKYNKQLAIESKKFAEAILGLISE